MHLLILASLIPRQSERSWIQTYAIWLQHKIPTQPFLPHNGFECPIHGIKQPQQSISQLINLCFTSQHKPRCIIFLINTFSSRTFILITDNVAHILCHAKMAENHESKKKKTGLRTCKWTLLLQQKCPHVYFYFSISLLGSFPLRTKQKPL